MDGHTIPQWERALRLAKALHERRLSLPENDPRHTAIAQQVNAVQAILKRTWATREGNN